MKLSELIRFRPMGEVDTTIGKLAVFNTSFREHTEVVGETSLSLKAVPPKELVKRLLPHIAHLADMLGEDKEKPKQPTLSEEQIAALTDDDVEKILGVYIEGRDDLTHRREAELSTNEAGERVAKLVYTDKKCPQKEGESNVDYLYRLYVLEENENKERMKKLYGQLIGSAHFSSSVNDEIKKSLSIGNEVSKAMEAMRTLSSFRLDALNSLKNSAALSGGFPKPIIPSVRPELPTIHSGQTISDLETDPEIEADEAPYSAVTERFDSLIEISAKASELMVQMNQTQIATVAEIKASGEEASKIGKDTLIVGRESLKVTQWGYRLTVGVVFLTAAGIGLSIWDRLDAGSDSALIEQQQADRESDRATIEELRIKLQALEARLDASGPAQQPVGESE